MRHQLKTKRAYDAKAGDDGYRVLVERLWPRGLTHEALAADEWLKDVSPTAGLRRWFGHDPKLWETFMIRYRQELEKNPEAWAPLLKRVRQGPVTLLYSAKDRDHNSALVLKAFLEERLEEGDPKEAGEPG